MTEEPQVSGTGAKYKEALQKDDDADVGFQLISCKSSDNGKNKKVTVRPADELKGGGPTKKRRRPRKETLLIPATILVVGLLLLSVFLVLTLYRRPALPRLADGLVETTVACGTVQGFKEDGAYAFRGIPYALPPVGDLRWKRTVPHDKTEDCWQGTLLAQASGPRCFQKTLPDVTMSEDCLYLDVFTPDVSFSDPKSVVVYFRGSSVLGDDEYTKRLQPSARLANQQQTVFVTVNYRLSAFGFLALKTLQTETESTGNYGLYDMIAALQWIQMNIDSFGGNPMTITLLGCGSSATAILGLVFSPKAHGLFNQVWMTGGSADFVNATVREADAHNRIFLRHLKCNDRHCLLHKSPEEIVKVTTLEDFLWYSQNITDLPSLDETFSSAFVVDKDIVTDLPSKLLKRGQYNDVSMVIGTPSYQFEALLRTKDAAWGDLAEHVSHRLANFSESLAQEAVNRYFINEEQSNRLQFARMVAEVRVLCPLFHLAHRARKRFLNVVHAYTTSYLPSDRKFHGSAAALDLAAIFDQLPLLVGEVTSEDREFSKSLRELFFRFVKYTRFGTLGRQTPKAHAHTYLDVTGQRIVPSYRSYHPHCDLWLRNDLYPMYARQN